MADSYTTLFTVRPEPGQSTSSLLQSIASQVARWAGRRQNIELTPEAGKQRDADSGHEFEIQTDSCDEGSYWRLRWSHPDAENRPVSWPSDVRLATMSSGQDVEFFVQVRVVSDPSAATAEPVGVGTPNLIGEIARDYDARAGGRPVRESPTEVRVGDEDNFVSLDVLAPDRALPILAISPRSEDNRPYLRETDVRRAGFVGLAEVCFITTTATTRNVSDLLGQDLACYNGAVRIWWPGINPEGDDPRQHHRWLPDRVAENPSRTVTQIYNLLTRVAERRAPDGGPVWVQVREAARQARENEFRRALADAELVDLADAQQDEMASLRADVHRLREEVESLRNRNAELQADNETLEDRLRDYWAHSRALPKEDQMALRPYVESMSGVVNEADGRFEYVRFSQESYRAAEQSQFRRPEEVYRAFQVLDVVGAEMAARSGDLGESLYTRFQNESLDYSAHESSTTMAQWAAQRRARYEDKAYEMEKHLKWGGRSRDSQHHLRLYFEWEPDGPYWVVGHVGDHLTNTKS